MKYPGLARTVLCAISTVVAWSAPPAAAQFGSNTVGQPPIANLPASTRPIDTMFTSEAEAHLQRIIDNNLRAYRRYEDEGLCRLFRVFTQTEDLNAAEDLLNNLARQINRFDPEAGRQAAEDVADYVRRVSALIRETKCPPEYIIDTSSPTLLPSFTVGTTVQRRQATDKVQTFGFRVGGIEFFGAVPLDNEDTQVAPMLLVPLPAFMFNGYKVDQHVKVSGFEHEASCSDALVPSNGNDLLLPGSSGPGVFLAGPETRRT